MKNIELHTAISELKNFLSEFSDAYNHKKSFRTAKIRDEQIAKDQRLIDRVNSYLNDNGILLLAYKEEVANNPMYLNEIRDELRHPENFRSTLGEVLQRLENKKQ